MGIVREDYGDACAIARDVARYGLPFSRAREQIAEWEAWVVEAFVASLHQMPPEALRSIADKIDPAMEAHQKRKAPEGLGSC